MSLSPCASTRMPPASFTGQASFQKLDGFCDYESRTIYVAASLEGQPLIETGIHEGLHAVLPDLSEEAVERYAAQIARLLVALGVS